ncbi:MAG: T9SS type A sorting domain-containing protein [Chitinophagaceae bacterium]|nr:T9SS type A sorting domain-containing protein [Chitinophagaceae bacterium]
MMTNQVVGFHRPNGVQAVCQTITGSFAAGDPTFNTGRLFRDGIASTCAAPKAACPGVTAVGTVFRYRTYTFTNPVASAQCLTITHTNTGAAGAPHLSVHSGAFNPANICTNYISDEGGSPNPTFNVVHSLTIGAGATVTLVLTETANAAGGTWQIDLDMPLCAPCIAVTSLTAPAAVSAQCSGSVTIPATLTPGGASISSWAWEYRVNASSPWLNLINGALGGSVSGATTSAITISPVSSAYSGYQFRAVLTPSAACGFGVDFSNASTLTVTQLQTAVTPTSATICKGSVIPLTITNPSSPQTAVFNASAGLPLPIPDANLAGVSNTIVASGLPTSSYVVSNITVTVSIPAHTWVGDLFYVLKAPNGQIINLDYSVSNTGVSGTGFVNTKFSSTASNLLSTGAAPYTGTFRADLVTSNIGSGPAGPTAFLPTTNSWANMTSVLNGNWTLALYDGFGGDTGSLTAWSISITYGAPSAGTWVASPAAPNTMWLDAGATIPYPGAPATANTIYVNPTTNTSYTATYSTASPSCPGLPVTVPVSVTQPLASIGTVANQTVCVGSNASFSVSPTSPAGSPYNGPFTYQWQESRDNGLTWANVTNGGVYSGATTNTLTLTGVTRSAASDMNLYKYRVNVSAPPCAGTTTSNVATLNVNALPAVSITATDLALTPGSTSVLTATSSPAAQTATSWSWTLNGSTIAGANTNSVTANVDKLGVYRATVTDVNGCRNSSNSLLIESEVSDRLWIYPNPTTGKFQIRWYYNGVYTEIRRVRIYNAHGQEIKSRDWPVSNITPRYLQMDMDLTGLSGGVYVIKVSDLYDKKHVQGLLIKQ